MIIGLLVFVGLTAALGFMLKKFCSQNVGHGLGNYNNKYWGMEEDNNRY